MPVEMLTILPLLLALVALYLLLKHPRIAILVCVLAVGGVVIMLKLWERQFHLTYVPQGA